MSINWNGKRYRQSTSSSYINGPSGCMYRWGRSIVYSNPIRRNIFIRCTRRIYSGQCSGYSNIRSFISRSRYIYHYVFIHRFEWMSIKWNGKRYRQSTSSSYNNRPSGCMYRWCRSIVYSDPSRRNIFIRCTRRIYSGQCSGYSNIRSFISRSRYIYHYVFIHRFEWMSIKWNGKRYRQSTSSSYNNRPSGCMYRWGRSIVYSNPSRRNIFIWCTCRICSGQCSGYSDTRSFISRCRYIFYYVFIYRFERMSIKWNGKRYRQSTSNSYINRSSRCMCRWGWSIVCSYPSRRNIFIWCTCRIYSG